MEKLITRKEAAEILGISIATLDAARNNGLISYVQYVQNGGIFYTPSSGIWQTVWMEGVNNSHISELIYCGRSPGVYRKMHAQSKTS